METTWRVPWLWRFGLAISRVVAAPFCRLRVSGEVPERLRSDPLILAANHVSPADPILIGAACAKVGLAPRFMATGGLFDAPVVGALMRRAGHLRVDRKQATVARAIPEAAAALKANSQVLVYPEGRIGLDPWMWPERGKTGVARMASITGAPVIPVAQWGAHQVLPYVAPKGLVKSLLKAMARRPVVHVRFGEPVDLADIPGSEGARAVEATRRIVEGIDRTLLPLRTDEPQWPRFVDRTRPVDLSRVRPRPGQDSPVRDVPGPVA